MFTLAQRLAFRVLLLAGFLAALACPSLAQERDRAKIPEKYKWNLADLYPTEAAWRDAKDKFAAEALKLAPFQGKLLSSPEMLFQSLQTLSTLRKDLSRLFVFASMLADEDTRDGQHQGMRQEMTQLASAFRAQAAFVEPELLRADKATFGKFISSKPELKVYEFYLNDLLRRAAHTLTASEEKMLADAGPLMGAPSAFSTSLLTRIFHIRLFP